MTINFPDQPDSDRRRLENEAAAAAAGFGPYYDNLAEQLTLSDAIDHIRTVQEGVQRDMAYALLLKRTVNLLPPTNSKKVWMKDPLVGKSVTELGNFLVGGDKQDHRVRQLQANVLWLREVHSSILSKAVRLMPNFIIGRRLDGADSDEAQLLLCPATGVEASLHDKYGEERPGELRLVTLKKKDLAVYDTAAASVQIQSFDEGDAEQMVDKQSGLLVVNSHNPHSIILTGRFSDRLGGVTTADVLKDGLPYNPKKTVVLKDGVSRELVDQLDVDATIGRLAAAFRVSDKLQALLRSGDPLMKPVTREDRLAAQNAALREALIGTLAASGVILREEVERRVRQKYPSL